MNETSNGETANGINTIRGKNIARDSKKTKILLNVIKINENEMIIGWQ